MDNLAKLYEDACILCAGVWFASSSSEGAIRLEGEDELRAGTYGRHKGMLVAAAEGGPLDDHERRRTASASTDAAAAAGEPGGKSKRHARRQSTGASSVWTLPLGWTWPATRARELYGEPAGEYSWEDLSAAASVGEEDGERRTAAAARREADVALALLRAFHAHSARLLARLADTLAPHLPTHQQQQQRGKQKQKKAVVVVTLTPKDLVALDLGPLSTTDARFVEWLADAWFVGGGAPQQQQNTRVVVRRARWRDVVGVVFGFS